MEEQIRSLEDKIKKLEKEIESLKDKRVHQSDLTPDVVKMRHVGEGVRFIRSGLAADRPTNGEEPLQGAAVYFATDSGVLSIWDGDAWVSETLT